MRAQTRYTAQLLAATMIGGAMILAPVALADSSAAAVPDAVLQAVAANPTPSPAPAPPPPSGGDPQVPNGTYLGYDANSFDGNSLAY